MTLDVRLTLRTHDDALVHMTYGGRWITPPELRAHLADPVKRHQVDPARYYFRTNPLFETGAERYAWLNDIVCIGSGYLVEGGVAYTVSQVVSRSAAADAPLRSGIAPQSIALDLVSECAAYGG